MKLDLKKVLLVLIFLLTSYISVYFLGEVRHSGALSLEQLLSVIEYLRGVPWIKFLISFSISIISIAHIIFLMLKKNRIKKRKKVNQEK